MIGRSPAIGRYLVILRSLTSRMASCRCEGIDRIKNRPPPPTQTRDTVPGSFNEALSNVFGAAAILSGLTFAAGKGVLATGGGGGGSGLNGLSSSFFSNGGQSGASPGPFFSSNGPFFSSISGGLFSATGGLFTTTGG